MDEKKFFQYEGYLEVTCYKFFQAQGSLERKHSPTSLIDKQGHTIILKPKGCVKQKYKMTQSKKVSMHSTSTSSLNESPSPEN